MTQLVMDEQGREVLSDVSLAVLPTGFLSLGDRVKRYMKRPEFQQDVMNSIRDLSGYHPEELEEIELTDDNPLAKSEDRYAAYQEQLALNAQKQKEAELEQVRKQEEAEKITFRKRLKELQEEGTQVPEIKAPSPSTTKEGA